MGAKRQPGCAMGRIVNSGFQYATRAEADPGAVPGVASAARMYDYWLGGCSL